MGRLVAIYGYLVRNRGPLFGLEFFRASHGFFIGYTAIVAGGIAAEPGWVAGGVLWSLLVELSNVLPPSRKRMRLTLWHGGLEIRSWWRIVMVAGALAAAGADGPLLAWVAATGFAYQLLGRFIRSSLFHLDSGRRLRPIGALTEGRELLLTAREVAHKRNRVQIAIQVGLLGSLALIAVAADRGWSGSDIALWLAVGGAAIVGIAAWRAIPVRRIRKALFEGYDEAVIAAFREYDPEVLCYFNGEPRSMFVLNVWLNVLASSRHRIAVVLRHGDTWRIESDEIPGVVVQSAVQLEQLPTETTSVVLYPANGMHNAHMMRDVTLSHVFLGHGDSDKASSVRPINRTYDRLWVAGQAAIDRYRAAGFDLPDGRFNVVGRPVLSPRVRDRHRDESDPSSPYSRIASDLRVQDKEHGKPLTVVYAPTSEGYFEDSNYTSLASMGPEMIATIIREFAGARVIYKPHPMSGHRLVAVREAGQEIRDMLDEDPHQFHPNVNDYEIDLYDWLDQGDVLVTDVSSVATDWLCWDKPLVITNPKQMDPIEFEETFPITRAAYVLTGGGHGIAEILDEAFGDDRRAATRRELRKHYLGDPAVDPMDAFDAALADLIAHPPSRVIYSRTNVAVPHTEMVAGETDDDPEDLG